MLKTRFRDKSGPLRYKEGADGKITRFPMALHAGLIDPALCRGGKRNRPPENLPLNKYLEMESSTNGNLSVISSESLTDP